MKVKVSASVYQFAPKIKKAWKLDLWEGINDSDKDLLFFGLFNDRDFEVFHNFEGKKSVFWCGGDILRLKADYERKRILKLSPETKHYCETEKQAEILRECGFEPIVIPSFLGDFNDYPISFKPPKKGEKWKIWLCGHENREIEYGFDQAIRLAKEDKDLEIHFYGVPEDYPGKSYFEKLPNVIWHGQVPEEQLDKEIRDYHCGLRPNKTDGISEVVMKSLLLGQYPISYLFYEGVWTYRTFAGLQSKIAELKKQTEPNIYPMTYWLGKLNDFPWMPKVNKKNE